MKYQAIGRAEQEVVGTDISQLRYLEVKKAKTWLLFALDLEEKVALVLDNFAEFEFELLRLAETSLVWPARGFAESMQERLSLDRRLVNLLSAGRLYCDQTDHGLSHLFGKTSQELNEIRDKRHELYAGHFGYRLMEALRNHVQHAGLLVHSLTYQSSLRTEDGLNYSEFTVVPQSRVETLAENRKFKPEVLRELQSGGETVDLRGPAREYVSCLVELHESVRETVRTAVADARLTYEAAVEEFSAANGRELRFPRLLELRDDGSPRDEVALVTDFVDYYDELLRRNIVSHNLQSSTASNSDQKKKRRGLK